MITENEMENLIHNPLTRVAANHKRPEGIWTGAAANRAEQALALWVAVLTHQYLRSIHAVSHPLVEKVWTFAAGKADIDMRVGVHGTYRKFKVETAMTGPQTLKLQIRSWHKRPGVFGMQEREDLWVRYGSYRGNSEGEGIETLPTR